MARTIEGVRVVYLASAVAVLSFANGCGDTTTTETPAPAANKPAVTAPPVSTPPTAAAAAKGIGDDVKPPVVVKPGASPAPAARRQPK